MLTVQRMVIGMAATNVWFVVRRESSEAWIVDPADDAPRIAAYIRQEELRPVGILLTHGHFDHMMAADGLRETFRIPVFANEAEAALLQDAEKNLSASWAGRPTVLVPDVFLRDGQEFCCGGFAARMIATPGHTAGGCCYYIPEEKILLAGDTLFAGSYGRTDLPTGDEQSLLSSITKRLLVLPPETAVYPGHGEQTTVGRERRNFGIR